MSVRPHLFHPRLPVSPWPPPQVIVELGVWLGCTTKTLANFAPEAYIYSVDYWDNEYIQDQYRGGQIPGGPKSGGAAYGHGYGALDDHTQVPPPTIPRAPMHSSTSTHSSLQAAPCCLQARDFAAARSPARCPAGQSMLSRLPLYETFLVNLWAEGQEGRVIPMRMGTLDALRMLAEQELDPDLIIIDADHRYLGVYSDVEECLQRFPRAMLLGTDYDYACAAPPPPTATRRRCREHPAFSSCRHSARAPS